MKAEEAVPVAEDAAETADEEKEDPETVKLREELAAVKGQLLRMEHERYLLSRGVPEEDLDYYAFKIEHSEGAGDDFRKAARDYLKAHPVRRTAVSSGAELGAAGVRKPGSANEMMNQLLGACLPPQFLAAAECTSGAETFPCRARQRLIGSAKQKRF